MEQRNNVERLSNSLSAKAKSLRNLNEINAICDS